VKWGVVYSLISRAKITCQEQKDFRKEIKNIRHVLMLNEYPQEFVDSIMKPLRISHPSSDTIYQGTVIIPYVKGFFETVRRIGNRFNVRTIFLAKHTLCGTLVKPGPVRDAKQTKQWVYNIPCEFGRCNVSETRRSLEICIKDHKYNLKEGLLEESKLGQHAYEEGHKICWNEAKVLQI
jgi:hypothetical protein